MFLASLMSEFSRPLYLSTPTLPHTLHAYKLHEKKNIRTSSTVSRVQDLSLFADAIIRFETFIFLEIQRFEKQGETFFQLLRFVIPESENYCYCPVICRSHSMAFMSSSYPLNH